MEGLRGGGGGGGGDQLQPRRYGPVSVRMRAEERACPAF